MAPGDSLYVVSGISISGNKVSRESIILKELTFKTGDTIILNELNESLSRSRENLLNTSLYNFVTISHTLSDRNEIQVYISVVERWYIWPAPIFEHAERNLGAFIHDPDWNRINYGGQIEWSNFRGRRENIFLKLRLGYKEQYELQYEKPNFGRNQKHGFGFTLNYMRQHEVNVYTENNKPVYLRNDNSYLAELVNPYITYSYRNSLYSKHAMSLAYSGLKYRDSASHENFTGLPDGEDPAYLSADYAYESDYRDSKAYPLTGDYFRIKLSRREFVSPRSGEYSRSEVQFTATHHRLLKNRLYYNDAIQLMLAKDEYEPKAYRGGLGYGSYLRGYELYVIDGNSYMLMVNNLKYCIMKERNHKVGYIPWSQFNLVHFSLYANLFFDMAYVQGKHYVSAGNSFVNRFLYTGGIGIDLVSYYDLVLRFEGSLNREGEGGFFIHTEVPFGRW